MYPVDLVRAVAQQGFGDYRGIESFYCRPGIESGHETGGVEGQIGCFRRNHFTPVPEVDSLWPS
ncbi:hypothetical protein ACIBTP_29625 [Streptomyces avidinii]|uniref:hypothetical protein n=1 Tax=Streptomyces avidinii TaxID=1895 RepID=UPI0037AB17B7